MQLHHKCIWCWKQLVHHWSKMLAISAAPVTTEVVTYKCNQSDWCLFLYYSYFVCFLFDWCSCSAYCCENSNQKQCQWPLLYCFVQLYFGFDCFLCIELTAPVKENRVLTDKNLYYDNPGQHPADGKSRLWQDNDRKNPGTAVGYTCHWCGWQPPRTLLGHRCFQQGLH